MMGADHASGEGELPDVIPAALIEAHGPYARSIVARSVRPSAADRMSVWAGRLADLAMIAAAIGIVFALGLLVSALPLLGIPLVGVAGSVVLVALVHRIVISRSR